MKKTILITTAMLVFAATAASAQGGYSYYVQRTIPINWCPDTKTVQRYTVAVNPFHLVNNGIKFDFEYELRQPGEWIQTSLITFIAPPRDRRDFYWYGDEDNNRWTFNSGGDNYHRMWGIGTSLLYKKMFSLRGWYFSTGLVLEFYRVGVMEYGYVPYKEDGLTFYREERFLDDKSYFKPTAQFNVGKHMSLSRRCFIDIYIGIGYSHSFFRHEYDNYYGYEDFSEISGFAYRGLTPNAGFRFGVLLWDK